MKSKIKTFTYVTVLILFAAAIVFSVSLDKEKTPTSDNLSPTRDKYLPVIEYKGEKYIAGEDIETVLFIGVDNFGQAESSEVYYNYGQADFLMLGIFNRVTNSYSLLHVNRDTVSDVTVLGLGGKRVGKERMQLALSHCYGTGMEDSCTNTVDAVSAFLDGTPIDRYFATNMDAVPMLNDLAGGVTLVVSEDFPDTPELKKGELVTLEGELALTYVRSRMSVADGSNANRMRRQREYIDAFFKSLNQHMDDESFAQRAYELIADYVVTDMDITKLSDTLSAMSEYTFEGIYTIEGTFGDSGEYVEFYADEDKLTELLIDIMYEPYYA